MLARIAASHCQDLGRDQVEDEAVLVGGPDRTILAQERRASAFLAAKAKRAVQQPIDEILEAHGHLAQGASQVRRNAVDHRARDQRLANGHVLAPTGPVLEQVPDGSSQEVIGVHQPDAAGDDAVAVVVRVVAEGDVELILELHQAGHRVGRGAVHANLAVVIQRHEREGWVYPWVYHVQVESVGLGDRLPEAHARAAHGIDTDLQAGRLDGRHVDDSAQLLHVGPDVVVLMRGRGSHRLFEGYPLDILQSVGHDLVGAVLDCFGDASIGWPARRRVVFEAAIAGRIMGWSDHDPVSQPYGAAAVVGQDSMRDDRGRRISQALLDDDIHPVGGKHLDGRN